MLVSQVPAPDALQLAWEDFEHPEQVRALAAAGHLSEDGFVGPRIVEPPGAVSIMAIAAHPDDIANELKKEGGYDPSTSFPPRNDGRWD